jgi:hypothetical protein
VNKELENVQAEAVIIRLRLYAVSSLERLGKVMKTHRIAGVLANN